MTVATPMPPRPDNTNQSNMFGGISGPFNPYGSPTKIPKPNPSN